MPLAMTGNWQMKNILAFNNNNFNNFITYNAQICIWPNVRNSIMYYYKNIRTFFDFSVVTKWKNVIESGTSYSVEHCIIS